MTAATHHEHPTTPHAPLIGPDGSYTRAGQTVAFILGLISLIFFPATVVAAILYTMGEDRFATDPQRARKLVNWSWITLVAWPIPAVCIGLVGYAVTAVI